MKSRRPVNSDVGQLLEIAVAKLTLTILALVALVTSNGCIRDTPMFRRLAEREDARRIKETNEAVARSPGLQELDRLCTKQIPIFTGFVPRGRFAGPTSKTSLTYFYRSPAEYPAVKSFYVNYFAQNAWTLTRQKENGWGPDTLEFRKSPYRIIISHGGLGDADYAMDCDKLSNSGEPLPNKSLDRSGGSVFHIKPGAVKAALIRAARSTLTLDGYALADYRLTHSQIRLKSKPLF